MILATAIHKGTTVYLVTAVIEKVNEKVLQLMLKPQSSFDSHNCWSLALSPPLQLPAQKQQTY